MSAVEVIRVETRQWTLLEEVAVLEREAFGSEGLTPESLALFTLSGAVYALRENGRLTAEALILANLDDGGALLFSLAVGAPFRRAGRGLRLMEAVIAMLRTAGRTSLRLTVSPANHAALPLYLDHLGFVRVDEIPDCFGPGHHRLLLQLQL